MSYSSIILPSMLASGSSLCVCKVYRFYGRCRHCWSEFTFKTDPKNSDYTMESGGKRTYEAWKDADAMEAELKREKEQEAAQECPKMGVREMPFSSMFSGSDEGIGTESRGRAIRDAAIGGEVARLKETCL